MIRPLPRNITTRPEKLVTSHLIRLINSWRVQPSSIGVTFAIPKFDEEDVTLLISEATRLLKMQHSVVKKRPSFIVVGDLHGNLFNLLQIFVMHGMPPEQSYVFLGNYTSQGEYNLEVMTFITGLFLLHPTYVTLLRSDVELSNITGPQTLEADCLQIFPSRRVYELYLTMFTYMPLLCIAGDVLICCQCIPVMYSSVFSVSAVKLPLESITSQSERFSKGIIPIRAAVDIYEAFINDSGSNFLVTSCERGGPKAEFFLDGKALAVGSDASCGSSAVVLIPGDRTPITVIFTPDVGIERESAFFEVFKREAPLLIPRPISRTVKPVAMPIPRLRGKSFSKLRGQLSKDAVVLPPLLSAREV